MELVINDRIRNREVKFFNNFQLSLKYDSLASNFSFGFYFDPDVLELKELACIGHYHICRVYHNGELLITGQVLSESFADEPQRQLMQIAGYSLPGVLEDCDIPTSLYPLQSDGLSMRQITERIIAPFGLKLKIDSIAIAKAQSALVSTKKKFNGVKDADTDAAYATGNNENAEEAANKTIATSTAPAATNVKSYLTELAVQKNIVLSHDAEGNVLITAANTDSEPILDFDTATGAIPGTSFKLSFNGQGMHSHITVIKQAAQDGDSDTPSNAGEYTIRNPYVINTVYRPRVIVQSSGDDVDTVQFAKNALAEELKNLKVTISTDRWEDKAGHIIKPNNTVTLMNPNIYLFEKTKLFIESIDFTGDNKSTTAVLTCVLPEMYNKRQPYYLFAGINEH